jgi:hypothetical protein
VYLMSGDYVRGFCPLSHTMHGSVEAEIGKVHPDIDSIKETNLWHTHSILYSDDMPH